MMSAKMEKNYSVIEMADKKKIVVHQMAQKLKMIRSQKKIVTKRLKRIQSQKKMMTKRLEMIQS